MKKLLYILPLFLIACSSSTEVEFERTTGKTNEVTEGSRFHINMSEDHKVGSGLWSVDPDYDNNIVGYVNSDFSPEDGGNVTFNFEAIKKGKTEIHLSQSFARDTMQKVAFIVEVK